LTEAIVFMKIFQFFAVALILSGVISCKKMEVPATSNVSNADAAAMIGGSTALNSYGVYSNSSDITVNAALQAALNIPGCGLSKTDTIIRHSTAGASVTYNYSLYYNHKLNCNTSNAPDNITGNLTYNGNYNNSNLSLTNSGSFSYTLAGLTATPTVYTLNGEYKSSGTFKLKADTTNTGTVSFDFVLKNVTISKTTQYFTGGTGTVIVTGTTTKKGDFTYNGTLTINSGSLATLVLNGTIYQVNLVLGTINP